MAFQILREIGVPSDDEIVQGGIGYFVSSFNSRQRDWPSTTEAVNDAPHAPWWHHDGDQGNAIDHSGWANPSAEIVGYLREYFSLMPEDFRGEVTALALADIQALPDEIDHHSILCYMRMAATLPQDGKALLLGKLIKSVAMGISKNPDSWPGNEPPLFTFAPSPNSPLAEVLSVEMETRLDRDIDNQAPDGSWLPNWSWGGQYEDAWEIAKVEWQGQLTLHTLLALRAYGRIAGV